MKKGAAITAAFISAPVGPLTGAFASLALSFDDYYERTLARNSLSRDNGYLIADPTPYEFFVSVLPTTMNIAVLGTVFAVVAHLLIGIPTVLFSANSFRESVIMQLSAPMIIGALSGVIFFSKLIGPLPSVVAGGAGAFAMALCARLFSRDIERHA